MAEPVQSWHPEALGGLLPAPDTTTNAGEIKRQAREHSRSRKREALTNRGPAALRARDERRSRAGAGCSPPGCREGEGAEQGPRTSRMLTARRPNVFYRPEQGVGLREDGTIDVDFVDMLGHGTAVTAGLYVRRPPTRRWSRVAGAIHFAHPAGSDQADNLVRPNPRAWVQSHGAREDTTRSTSSVHLTGRSVVYRSRKRVAQSRRTWSPKPAAERSVPLNELDPDALGSFDERESH